MSLQKLSREHLQLARVMIEVLSRMDDDEYTSTTSSGEQLTTCLACGVSWFGPVKA